MAPIRMSGMNSGLDTESIVKAMVMGYEAKKQKVTNNQTKLEWSQEIWKGVNSKVYSLYTSMDKVRFSGAYKSKKTTVSDSTKATVKASSDAVNGTQKLRIQQLASSGYLTGGKVKERNGNSVTADTKVTNLGSSGITAGSQFTIKASKDATPTTITIDQDTTIGDLVNQMRDAGVNASYDAANGRFFVSAKESGEAGDFEISGVGTNGVDALKSLGLYVRSDSETAALQNMVDTHAYTTDASGNKTRLSDSEILANMKSLYEGYQNTYSTALSEKNALEQKKTERQGISEYLKNKEAVLNAGLETSNTSVVAAARARVDANDGSATDEDKALVAAYDFENKSDKTNDENFYINEANKTGATVASVHSLYTYNENTVIANLDTQINEKQSTMNTAVSQLSATGMFTGYDSGGIDSIDSNDAATAALNKIKNAEAELNTPASEGATRAAGEDAIIYLNGAQFTSSSNTIEVNGLTINATGTTGNDEITITTSQDVDGIYDKFKEFLSQYNDVINELQGLYNAESAKGYDPLTDEQKEEMSEKEIEKWETKIKDSLLRRDTTLGGVINTMTMAMSQSYSIKLKDGTTANWALASVGVHTLGFLNAKENEQYAYHIDGDEDDENTSTKTDKLRAFIEDDPDAAADLLSQIAQGFYTALGTKVGATTTDNSSAYTIYNDKQMKRDLDQYKKDIKEWETRIADQEDFYYNKFTAMEKALAKLNSSQSALGGMFGS